MDGPVVMGSDGGATAVQFRPASRPIPPKLYRIGEVVEYSGMSRQTIHNYTTMGLLHESRWTTGGHRLYDESVFRRLDQIAELKAASKSIEDIRDLFQKMSPDS
jgi:DNA-binding transcriptional MerR regulator